jgi:hypothetical protein
MLVHDFTRPASRVEGVNQFASPFLGGHFATPFHFFLCAEAYC